MPGRKRHGWGPHDVNVSVDPEFDDAEAWLDEATHNIEQTGSINVEKVFLDNDYHNGYNAWSGWVGHYYGPPIKPLQYVPYHVPTPEELRQEQARKEANARCRQKHQEYQRSWRERVREQEREDELRMERAQEARFEIEPDYDLAAAQLIIDRIVALAKATKLEMFSANYPAWSIWACPDCNYRGVPQPHVALFRCQECRAAMIKVARYTP